MTDRYALIVRELVAEADRRAAITVGRRLNKGNGLALLMERDGFSYKPTAVRSWIRGDTKPPADVLLAALHRTGISLDEKLGLGSGPTTMERQLAELANQVAELQRLAGLDPTRAVTASIAQLPSLTEILGRVQALERDMAEIGHVLRRGWEMPVEEAEISINDPRDEDLRRRLGTLQARMIEARSLVGLPWSQGHLQEPSAEDPDMLLTYFGQVTGLLQQQLAELRGTEQYRLQTETDQLQARSSG